MYYSMEAKVENILLMGKVEDQYIESEQQREAFNKWTDGFTRHDHPTVIQVCTSNPIKCMLFYLNQNCVS